MAIAKRKVFFRSPYRWHSDRLHEHSKKHGTEVALTRQVDPRSANPHSYENSSHRTILTAPIKTQLKRRKDQRSNSYTLDSHSLLTITDPKEERILTHYPIGVFGDEQSRWLGSLPQCLKELHGLRCLYRRIRTGLYQEEGRSWGTVVETYLTDVVAKELECCDLLPIETTDSNLTEAAGWLKSCMAVDWEDAANCIKDASIRNQAAARVKSFLGQEAFQDYLSKEMDRMVVAFLKTRLMDNSHSEFPDILGDNSWTYTEAFLHFLGIGSLLDKLLVPAAPNKPSEKVVTHFQECAKRSPRRPFRFYAQVRDYLSAWLGSVSWAFHTPTYSSIAALKKSFQR